jgi:hypothetical protein
LSEMAALSGRVEQFVGHVVSSCWPNDDVVHRQAERFLASVRGRLDDLVSALSQLRVEEFAHMTVRSRETSTHYKWHLHADPQHRFVLWLHEYKTAGLRSPGYADSIHNHRYGLSSLVLSGGYTHMRFVVRRDPAEGRALVNRVAAHQLGPGSTYSISADEFHRVADLVDGTVTLVVEHPAIRAYSTSVDTAGHVLHHYPIEARYDELRVLLAGKDGLW